ncbi:MAG: carboxypeptidase-like regulatory domain-containing protein [Acidobacteriota bacterium]
MKWYVLFLLPFLALGQDPRGGIVGQVTDSTGGVVPGVTVRLTHQQTNVATTVRTNNQGNYEALYLLTGAYALSAEMRGFRAWTQPGIELRIGDRLRIDIQLQVGEVTETIEVTAQAPVLESTTGSIG